MDENAANTHLKIIPWSLFPFFLSFFITFNVIGNSAYTAIC